MIITHHLESDPNIKNKREDEGLRYVGSILLKGNKPRNTCFYDNTKLEEMFELSDGLVHKVCNECGMCYQVPKN